MVRKPCAGACERQTYSEGPKRFRERLEHLVRTGGLQEYPTASEAIQNLECETASIAVLDEGNIDAWTIGNSRYEPDTLCQACSISKPITGLAVMKLHDQGRLNIDEPLKYYLDIPDLLAISTPSTRELVYGVSIRMLLNHTSGFSVHGFHGYRHTHNEPDARRVLSGASPSNTVQTRLEGIPGESFAYSGGGFVILQRVLELLLRRPFATLMHDLVLRPLGMTRSKFCNPKPGEHADAHYTGFTPCDTPFRDFPERAAAGLWTTPTDLLKAIRSMQHDLTSDSDMNFSRQRTAAEMLRVFSHGMALSWMAPGDPCYSFGHTGDSEPGWTCMVAGFADIEYIVHKKPPRFDLPTRSGICIMTNTANGHRVYRKLFSAICYLKGWPSLRIGMPDGCAPLADIAAVPDSSWKQWIGHFGGQWNWYLSEDGKGMPFLQMRGISMKLVPGAIPSDSNPGRKRLLNFVVPGVVGTCLRLVYDEGKRCIEYWREDGDGSPSVTKRIADG